MKEPTRRQRAARAVAGIVIAVGALFVVPAAVAHADTAEPVATAGAELVITPVTWTIITGLVLPFVLALVLKASASSTFKGVVGIVTAAVAAIVARAATIPDGSAVISTGLLLDVGMVYGPQLLTYLGLWQHIDLNQKVAPRFGIGGGGHP